MNYQEKELIWVSKELAAEYKSLETIEEQEKAVKAVITRKKLDLDDENNLLSESLLQFKSVCLVHKKELEKVYNEQGDILSALWVDMGDVSNNISRHAKQLASEISIISKAVSQTKGEVEGLRKSLNGLDVYSAEKLTALATQINRMDDDTKDILKFLLNNYNKSEVSNEQYA